MSALLIAHAGHWLTTVGFALAPLTVIGGIVALALIEHRRGGGTRAPLRRSAADRVRGPDAG